MKILNYIFSQKKRIFMSLFGVLVSGVCVGFMKVAAFGVDPFQVLVAGLDRTIPIQFGTLYVLINVVLLLFSLVADRHNIGLATFINLLLLGYVVDMFDFRLIDFPVFNVADILLCVGVGMMAVYVLVMEPRLEKQAKEAGKDGDHLSDSRS